ncbi:MAG TPA: Mut7-C RNAse domain-containing protein [Dehalococcoidia bacterium]|nr:Mut7-C RNAse domain-containing protein [Dehalococcoidia bacterium]
MGPARRSHATITVALRFYAQLNGFLPIDKRQVEFACSLKERAGIKDVIEAAGVPHTEVDLLLVNGDSVGFEYQVRDGDRISVYPHFAVLDVGPVSRVRPEPVPEPRFLLDTHLGKLAGHLRMLGFDTAYFNDCDDDVLARLASEERRILLTRDRGLLKRGIVTHGCHVWETDPERQLVEVLDRFDLTGEVKPFRRCLQCNGLLEPVAKEAIVDRLQPKTRLYYQEFARCRSCDRIYWKGSHYERMRHFIAWLLEPGARPEPGLD